MATRTVSTRVVRCLLAVAIVLASSPATTARTAALAFSFPRSEPQSAHAIGLQTAVAQPAGSAPEVIAPTAPEWINLYGLRVWVDGRLAPAGAVVEARTPAGLPCGQTTVETPGQFGLLTVYRDDPATAEVEGGDLAKPFLLWLTTGRRPLTTNGL